MLIIKYLVCFLRQIKYPKDVSNFGMKIWDIWSFKILFREDLMVNNLSTSCHFK